MTIQFICDEMVRRSLILTYTFDNTWYLGPDSGLPSVPIFFYGYWYLMLAWSDNWSCHAIWFPWKGISNARSLDSALRSNCHNGFPYSVCLSCVLLAASIKYQSIQLILSINQSIQWVEISQISCLSACRKTQRSKYKILNNVVKVHLCMTNLNELGSS